MQTKVETLQRIGAGDHFLAVVASARRPAGPHAM